MKHAAYALSLFVGLLFLGTVIDNDAWFLLNCGRYVESSGIPHVEPFTMHEGWHYVMQQWLFALGLWKVYSAAGLWGLVAFSYAAGAVVIYLFARLVRQAAGGNRAAVFAIVVPVGVFLSLAFFRQRPQMVSTAVFLIEIYLLERYQNDFRKWLLPAFFALSVLVVNAHAAMWPMMLVLLLPYLAEALVGRRLARLAPCIPFDEGEGAAPHRVRVLLLLAAAVLLGGFVNPYGVEAMTYSLHALGHAEVQEIVTEMHPVSTAAGIGTGWIALAAMFCLTAVYARHPVPLRHLLLAAGTGLMALMAVRSLFLFAVFATFPLGRVLAAWRTPMPAWTPRRKRLCALLLCGNALLFAHVLAPRYAAPAAATAELLDFAASEGRQPGGLRVYTGFTAGGLVELAGFRCYMDPRAEVFLPTFNGKEDVFHAYYLLYRGLETPRAFLAGEPFDVLVTERTEPLYQALAEDADYELLWDSRKEGVAGEAAGDVRIYRKR